MAVTLPAEVALRYRRLSLYNSPYPAHDRGRAVDLYPDAGAPSPVAGEVIDVRTVRAPPKPFAAEEDHLLLVDTGEHVARILHVDPAVGPGDRVAVGDDLGTLVRSGYFAPWVGGHLHLGFRERGADPYRASGSLPVRVAAPVEPVGWDGTGTVREVGGTYAVLDAPDHPAPGECFAGVDAGGSVLDGGLPHYQGGGALGGASGPVALAGTRVGTADGRDVTWDDLEVLVDGRPVTGLSLFLAREALGVKVVCPDRRFAVGESVAVEVVRA